MKEPAEVLLRAIRRALKGGVFVSETVTNHFLEGIGGGPAQCASFPLKRLTDREIEVFELIGQGKGNHEIARQLSISARTVDAHRAHPRKARPSGRNRAHPLRRALDRIQRARMNQRTGPTVDSYHRHADFRPPFLRFGMDYRAASAYV